MSVHPNRRLKPTRRGCRDRHQAPPTTIGRAGFTLIELMAVVLVITLLVAITMNVTTYVRRQVAVSVAKAQIAAMGAALEAYKSDWGYYPPTCPCRLSRNGFCEGTNNWILWRALSGAGGRRAYMTFPPGQLNTNLLGQVDNIFNGSVIAVPCNFVDPWGRSYVYFNSPATPYSNHQENAAYGMPNAYAGYTFGGQVNVSAYDLFSFGPDQLTFVPGCLPYYVGSYAWYAINYPYANTNSANDDITNWKQ